MSIASLSIKRPTFITCIVILMLALGYMSLKKMPVDLFPNVTFPIVSVHTIYPGAGPKEVETLISRVVEEEMSTVPGIKTLRSVSKEGISIVIAEFTLETDIKYAEQLIRDKVSSVKRKLPTDIKEPTIKRIDPSDQPVMSISLIMPEKMTESEIYDIANEDIKPKFEQINQVGLVDLLGARKREIQVVLDRKKLKDRELSATTIASRLEATGANIPAGKVNDRAAQMETVFRAVGEFQNIKDIENTTVSFYGNDVATTIKDVAIVKDSLVEETNKAYFNGKKSVFLDVYKQSGSNTIAVANNVKKMIEKVNKDLEIRYPGSKLTLIRDMSKPIQDNIDDVKESITMGIILTLIVVFLFLGSIRSTIITGLALPNSLLGAFVLIGAAGFSINIMSLLALSLAVGLLVDDAIVVRENIFRHMQMGKDGKTAAVDGTNEVMLAVIATTLTVIAVFGPIAFLKGVVGQFFKEFGLTVCFAMAISLFDALTVAPMMSAYFANKAEHGGSGSSWYDKTFGRFLKGFDGLQTSLENVYGTFLKWVLNHQIKTIFFAVLIFISSLFITKYIPKTFLPPQDNGEFTVAFELPAGTSLDATNKLGVEIDELLRQNKEILKTVLRVGSKDSDVNKGSIYVGLVPSKQRNINTSQMKDILRKQLAKYQYAMVKVMDIDSVAGGQRPFNVNIVGQNLEETEKYAKQLFEKLKNHPALKDPDISYRPGKPEFQIIPDRTQAQKLGVSTSMLGSELRNQIEGIVPIEFRENGREYDIRVVVQENQKDLRADFNSIYVPNINNSNIPLAKVAKGVETTGPVTILRQDRGRYVSIGSDIAPNGPGMGGVMADIKNIFDTEIKLPPGMSYAYVGQAENFKELGESMITAALLGVLFIYLVLASLYESFVTPFTIMLVLPLAATGAFYALLISGASLDLFSMIGCIMLLGVATKNSILIVDYANQLKEQGMELKEAVILAGKTRLRPILMTSFALIAGMIPIAIGLNEASKQRTSMGIAIIGGLISSTLLSLIVIPAAYSFIERFRLWSLGFAKKVFGVS